MQESLTAPKTHVSKQKIPRKTRKREVMLMFENQDLEDFLFVTYCAHEGNAAAGRDWMERDEVMSEKRLVIGIKMSGVDSNLVFFPSLSHCQWWGM